MSIYQTLLSASASQGAAYCVLVDPDKIAPETVAPFIEQATEAGVDAFFVGGSLVMADTFEECIRSMKAHTTKPVVIFPGSIQQISKSADAILFLSIISGRNAEHLIGDQVLAAPIIRKMNLEAISTGYMLIESGKTTSAEFMSGTRPIPRDKPDIAAAHALAAEYLGFKLVYLEAGSGADQSVPEEMIAAVAHYCSIPLIVGGGLRTPEAAQKKVKAGARFIVTGNVLESGSSASLIKEFADAIHTRNPLKV
ncbi:MAG: geranylgeranylglyceryl/heptaprenylglyceryl phosphate synthase [Ignavibacteriales bacterium]|nr:geranylgeranylglyceryl/heptaprenylglyceryl phosphate synthase [Ignavibacteriales bacterium]